jgi:hypothetical protein
MFVIDLPVNAPLIQPTHLLAGGAEASALGLAPGEWPEMLLLRAPDDQGRLVENLYHRSTPFFVGQDNEFGGYNYFDRADGYCLKIFND